MLDLLDQLIALSGAIILVAWVIRAALKSQGDTLLPNPPFVFREDAVLLAALAYFAGAMILSGLMQARGFSPEHVLFGIVVNNGAQLCGIAACAALAVRRVRGGMRSFVFGANADEGSRHVRTWVESACLIVVAVGVCPLIRDATAWTISWVAPGFPLETHPTLKALEAGGLPRGEVVALWLGAGVIAPIAEEMFFRGILQNFLMGAFRRPGPAIALSAVAFGMVHISQPHAVPALIFFGALLGWSYFRTGKLIVPIAIHAAFNLKTLVWEAMGKV